MEAAAMQEIQEIIVGIADIKIGETPAVLKTSLGSCIGVCLYSYELKKGGLLHFMLPSAGNASDANVKKAKYADTGIQELLLQLKAKYGINKERLTAKIFGGAKILANVTYDIGKANAEAAKKILVENGIRVISSKTGGTKGYRIEFDLETGKVKCQIFGGIAEEF